MNNQDGQSAEAEAASSPTHDAPNDDAAFRAAVRKGIDDVNAGRTIPYAEVRKWLESWGTPHKLPAPRVK